MTKKVSANFKSTLVFFVLVFTFTAGAQDVYRVTDKDGNVTYTDAPGDAKAEKIERQPANIIPPVTPLNRPSPSNLQPDSAPKSYDVTITSPNPETHLNPGEWDLQIQVATKPALNGEHRLELLVNGSPSQLNGGDLTIEQITRGTHVLQAQVVNKRGKVISRSEPVNVYVHRPTVNN